MLASQMDTSIKYLISACFRRSNFEFSFMVLAVRFRITHTACPS